ncbi:MAG: dTMP kinase [Coxiellaceae bacterium]|nr:dTMP kinase [Coxiellaceae bacterium]
MSTGIGYFISLEGVEGVGKSTAKTWIESFIRQHGIDLVVTREPGGTDVAEEIRQVLLDCHQEPLAIDTEVLLMYASRAQNIEQVIAPALAANQWVLADRFADASLAYQGGGRQVGQERMAIINEWVLKGLKPDLTILLDAPVEVGLERLQARGEKDRIEQESVSFFHRVRDTYLELATKDSERYRIVDATQSISAVEAQLKLILSPIVARSLI